MERGSLPNISDTDMVDHGQVESVSGKGLHPSKVLLVRRHRLFVSLVLAAAVLGANVVHHCGWAATEIARFIPLRCPLFALFNLPCPTCGLGRSLVLLATGQWSESWKYHPCGIPATLILGASLLGSWLAPEVAGRLWACSSSSLRVSRGLSIGLVVMLLGVFAFRLVTGRLAIIVS